MSCGSGLRNKAGDILYFCCRQQIPRMYQNQQFISASLNTQRLPPSVCGTQSAPSSFVTTEDVKEDEYFDF